jgi:hypothetical protein
MKEETKKAFEVALALSKARDDARQSKRQKEDLEQQQFEAKARQVRDSIVAPALQKVANDILSPNGWIGRVTSTDQQGRTQIDVYKGNMSGFAGAARPNLTFTANSSSQRFDIRATTQRQRRDLGSMVPEEITADIVHEQAAMFFGQLVEED